MDMVASADRISREVGLTEYVEGRGLFLGFLCLVFSGQFKKTTKVVYRGPRHQLGRDNFKTGLAE